jgi:hypothetical protein
MLVGDVLSLANVCLAATLALDLYRVVRGGCEVQFVFLALFWIVDAALYHSGVIFTVPILQDVATPLLLWAVAVIYLMYLSLAAKRGLLFVALTLASAAAFVYDELLVAPNLTLAAFNHAKTPFQVTHASLLAVDLALLLFSKPTAQAVATTRNKKKD